MVNFKRIASVLASTVMLGSTLGFAAAANYPAPFVDKGSADVAVVYGTNAAQTDLAGVIDITSSLSSQLAKQTASSGSSGSDASVSGGDFVKIAKSTDELNLGNNMSQVFGVTIDKDDLSELLADGVYLNDENTEYNYEQKISLDPNGLKLDFFADSGFMDKEPSLGIHIGSNTKVLNYTLDFTTDPESDLSSGEYADFETTDINLLGKSYYVLDADANSTTSSFTGTFTLLDSATTAIVSEGESQTVTVGEKSYDVSINFIGSSTVKLDINGETTNSLSQGQTYKLKDDTYVGVKEINVQDYAGGSKQVVFSLGSGKLELFGAGQSIELNDNSVQEIKGWIYQGTAAGGKEKIDKIVLEWVTDEEAFVAPGSDLVMPAFEAIKISMADFYTPASETIEVDYSGDDNIELTWPFKDGSYAFDILFANASGEFIGLGTDTDERLATSNTSTLLFNHTTASDRYHEYFVATYNTSDDGESYLLAATINEVDRTNKTTVTNVITGEEYKDKKVGDQITIGDVTLTVTAINKTATERNVLFTAGTGVNFHTLISKEGLTVYLPYLYDIAALPATSSQPGAFNYNSTNNMSDEASWTSPAGYGYSSFILWFDEENKEGDFGFGNSFNVTLNDNTDNKLHITDIDSGVAELDIPGTDSDTVTHVISDLATKITRTVASDKGKAVIEYYGAEAYGNVFVTDISASVEAGSGSSSGGTVKELGSVSVADSEVSSVSGKNLIVVGGSCVNSVAADLLGGKLCGANFEEETGVGAGSFLIQTFERSSGKVATLVAGYNAADTTNAAKYLTTQTVDTSVGKKYKGTSATSATLETVTA